MRVCQDISNNKDFRAIVKIRELVDVLEQYVVKCFDVVITKRIVKSLTDISAEAIRKLLENCFPSTDKIPVAFSEQFIRALDLLTTISGLPGIKNAFVQTIAPIIFGSILTDPCLNSWCGKQIFSAFNVFIQQSDMKMRRQLVTDNSMSTLCQLVDFISVCGDYDYQTVIMECIYRMCQKHMLTKYSKELIPEDEVLRKAFEAIEWKICDPDIRTFLNLLNKKYDNIYSILCDNLFVDDQSLPGPIEYGVTGLWVDFNKKFQSISWYVDRAFLNTANHELFVLPLEAVRDYHFKELDNSVEMFFQLNGKMVINEILQSQLLNPKQVVLHTKKMDDAKLIESMINEYLVTSKNNENAQETPLLSGSQWSKKVFSYKISEFNKVKDIREAVTFPIHLTENSLAQTDVIKIISDDEEEESLPSKRFTDCATDVNHSNVATEKKIRRSVSAQNSAEIAFNTRAVYKLLSVVCSKETSSVTSTKSNYLINERKIRQKGVLAKTIDDDIAVEEIQYEPFNLTLREVENEYKNQLIKSRSVTPLSHGEETFRMSDESEEIESEYYTAQMEHSKAPNNDSLTEVLLENLLVLPSYSRIAKFVGDSEPNKTAIDEIASIKSDIELVNTLERLKSNTTTEVLLKKGSSIAKQKPFTTNRHKANTKSLEGKHHWKIKLRSIKKKKQRGTNISSSNTTSDHTDNFNFESSIIDLTELENETEKASIVVDNIDKEIIEIFDDATQLGSNEMESETPDGLELKSNSVINPSDDVQQHNSDFVRNKQKHQTKDDSKSYSSTHVEENLNLQTKTDVINNNKDIHCQEEERLSQVSTGPLSVNCVQLRAIEKICHCKDTHLDANHQEISTPLETNVSLQFVLTHSHDADSELLQKQLSLNIDNEREKIIVSTENGFLPYSESQIHHDINDLNDTCQTKNLLQNQHESNENKISSDFLKELEAVCPKDNLIIVNGSDKVFLHDSQSDSTLTSSLDERVEIKEAKHRARGLFVKIKRCDNVEAIIRNSKAYQTSVQSSEHSENESDLSSPVIISRKKMKKRKRLLSSVETQSSYEHDANLNQTFPNLSKEPEAAEPKNNSRIVNGSAKVSSQHDLQSSLNERAEIKEAKRGARNLFVKIKRCNNVEAIIRNSKAYQASVQSGEHSEDESDLSSPVIVNKKKTIKRKRQILSSVETNISYEHESNLRKTFSDLSKEPEVVDSKDRSRIVNGSEKVPPQLDSQSDGTLTSSLDERAEIKEAKRGARDLFVKISRCDNVEAIVRNSKAHQTSVQSGEHSEDESDLFSLDISSRKKTKKIKQLSSVETKTSYQHDTNINQTVSDLLKEPEAVGFKNNSRILNESEKASPENDSQSNSNQTFSSYERTEIKEVKHVVENVNLPEQSKTICLEDLHVVDRKKDSPQQTFSVEHADLCYESFENDLKNTAKRGAQNLFIRIKRCDNIEAITKNSKAHQTSVQSSKQSEGEGDLSSPDIINKKITRKRKQLLSSVEMQTSSYDLSESKKIDKDDSVKKIINVDRSDEYVILSPLITVAHDGLDDDDRIHKQVKDTSIECSVEKNKENTSDLVTERAEHSTHSSKIEEKADALLDHNISRVSIMCDSVPNEKPKSDSLREALETTKQPHGGGINKSLEVVKDGTCEVLNSLEVLNMTKTTTTSTRSKRRKLFDPNDLTYMESLPNITECDIELKAKNIQIIQKEKSVARKMNISKGIKRKSTLKLNTLNKFIRTTCEKRELKSFVKNEIPYKRYKRKFPLLYKHFEGKDNESVDFNLEKFIATVSEMLEKAYEDVRLELGKKQRQRQHKKSHVTKQFRENKKTSTQSKNISFDDSIIPDNALEIEASRIPEEKRIKILSNVVLQNKKQ